MHNTYATMLSLFSFVCCLYPYYRHTGLASSCGSWEFSRHKFSFFHRYTQTHTHTKIDLPIRNVVLVAAQRTPVAPITITITIIININNFLIHLMVIISKWYTFYANEFIYLFILNEFVPAHFFWHQNFWYVGQSEWERDE